MTILRMSFSAGILIAVIVVLRTALLHRLPKWVFPTLWAAALFRLLFPLSLPSRFSFHTLAAAVRNHFLRGGTAVQEFFPADPLTGYDNMAGQEVSWNINISAVAAKGVAHTGMEIAGAVWLLGLSVCALFFLGKHIRCLREYRTALPVEDQWIEDWKQAHWTGRTVDIRQSDQIGAALTYGLFRPVVLLPKGSCRPDRTKLGFVLSHEFMHIRRLDIPAKWLLAAAMCVHWFNPLAWVMYLLANRDMELACDEAVIRALGEDARSAYALTLIELQEKQSPFRPLAGGFSRSSLEERTVSIMKTKKMTIAGMAAAIAVILCTIAVFATDSRPAPTDSGETAGQEKILTEQAAQGKVFTGQGTFAAEADTPVQLPFYMDEPVSLQNGAAPVHDVANGHLVLYGREEGDWTLQQGEKVTIDISISDLDDRSFCVVRTYDSWEDVQKAAAEVFYESDVFSGLLTLHRAYRIGESESFTAVFGDSSYDTSGLQGQTAVIGYIVDGAARELFSGRIAGSQTIDFYAPRDGEYEFYLLGASSDTIHVQSLSIQ